jgi:putative addiction module antidote
MNKPLKIIKIGNSAGVILPKDLLDRLKLDVGDTLAVNQTPDGLSLSTKDPEFDDQMARARTIMKRYRNALSELAK